MDTPQLVIASNRGPVSFARDRDGKLVPRRGGGGLIASLGPLVAGTDATWVAAAMSDADREAAAGGVVEAEGFRFRCLDIDPATYRMAYDVVANSTLWFLHHHLWDLPRRPRFDRHWRQAWDGYRAYNEAFARALADEAPDGATVLVQDYHLCLVAPKLAAKRPDLRPVHFHHTPFCSPEWLEVVPTDVAVELLEGLAAYDACGFHSPRWEAGFRACAERVLGAAPPTFVAPLPPAAANLEQVAASEACAEAGRGLDEVVGDRRLIVRVDRMEPSKNIVRGFFAFDELLGVRADLREKVVFSAFCYPSREGLAEYLGYHREVEAAAEMVNGRWGTDSWTPVLLFDDDNFPRSVAALERY
ncbi:MAG TPA: trehalose-6-phosphate synthase, partial [Acidimicrobiales bacterium]|nr:trehalose-6-phosphate synthase [Acidimicrobiales bacterium]